MAEQEVAESVITDEMREAIGKESAPTTLEVDKTGCRMFARAVGHTDLIFYDEEYAKSKGHRGIVAPPGFFGTPAFKPGGGRSEGPPARGFSIPYKRVLNGGTEYEYLDSVCAGDRLTSTTKISGFTERKGSIGPMLITERETTYTNQAGNVVAKMLGTTIQY
ncbi:MAG: MaoC family dehydratase N-terminal domain-containing protein [Chloroflexi bacterium]|nr:MaoC family dehydratase N-terminal domain-containing protein [Chloroflexota bacterium]MCI0889388.1 MaoC family dehydratase N-terminal domain-containing protein [Chloroflexota bacterium]